eukprot:scaffold1401_cov330-Pavlova_lutheri.AAC.170
MEDMRLMGHEDDDVETSRGPANIRIVKMAPQVGATDRQRKANVRKERGRKSEEAENGGLAARSVLDWKPSQLSNKLQQSFEYCSARLKQKINSVVQDINTESLGVVVDFVEKNSSKIQEHAVITIGNPLPVGLLIVGGISSIDHAKSFKVLCGLLSSEKCCSASVHGSSLVKSKIWNAQSEAVNRALNSLLKQVSGLDSDADDTTALAHWHRECGEGRTVAVVIEEVEAADPEVLKEFVHVLSDLGSEIPVNLLLGLSTLGNNLYDILPSNVISRTVIRRFETKPSIQQKEIMIEKLFLDPRDLLPFALCPKTTSYLDEHFLRRDMSLDAFERSVHFALVSHFLAEPLCATLPCFEFVSNECESTEADALIERGKGPDVLKDVDGLPESFLEQLSEVFSLCTHTGKSRKHHLQLTMQTTIRSRREWILALRLVNASAAHVGCTGVGSGLTFRELHRDASDPSFFTRSSEIGEISPGLHLIAKVRSRIEDLARETALALVEKWEALLRENPGLLTDVVGELEHVRNELQTPANASETSGKILQEQVCQELGSVPSTATPTDFPPEHAVSSKPRRLSAARRKGALVAHVNALAVGRNETDTGQARRDITRGVGARLGDLLYDVAVQHATKCPISLPGAELFCLAASSSLKQSFLEASPRQAMEDVLLNPTKYDTNEKLSDSMQGNGFRNDWSVAYRTLQKFDRILDMQEWCATFVDQIGDKRLPTTSRQGSTKRQNTGRPTPGLGTRKEVRLTQQLRQRKARTASSASTKFDWSSSDPLVVRFLQAAVELQISGIIRPCRRRQGDYVERLVHEGPVPDAEDIDLEE